MSRLHDLHLVSFVQRSWFETFYEDVDRGIADARRHLAEHCSVHDFVPISMDRLGRAGRWWWAGTGLFARGGYTVRWLRSAQMAFALNALRSRVNFDLVHCDTISLAHYRQDFPNAAATLGHHNIESHMLRRRGDNADSAALRWYFRREADRLEDYERNVSDQFDCHITCSRLDSDRLKESIPGATVVDVPNGVDIDFFQPGRAGSLHHDLIFVGTMDWYPNVAAVEFLLDEVWPIIKRRRPGTTLGIVGSNPSRNLRERAETDANLTVYGYVDDVRPYLEGASIFVCPIRDGGGTKLKILDAMAMRCCIVAHPIACEGIGARDRESVWLAQTPEEFAESIEMLLEQPERRRMLGLNARSLAESEFSYKALGEQLALVWQRAVLHHERAR